MLYEVITAIGVPVTIVDQPLRVGWYEDGSRKGEDNVHIVFDWKAMQARLESVITSYSIHYTKLYEVPAN